MILFLLIKIIINILLFIIEPRKYKALEFKCRARNTSLKIQDEYYTSKVCTNCTYKNDILGGNQIFTCPSCNLSIKRDYNGARNIMLKSLL